MKKVVTTSSLTLNGLQLSVFLGVYPKEKIKPQIVNIDACIHFPKPLLACQTDRLEDTYCYDEIIHYLKENLIPYRFQLIEKFTQTIYSLLKDYFPASIMLSVRVTKQPHIPGLTQGVTFEYGDKVTTWSS